MSAKRAAQALLELDTELAAFAADLKPGYDPAKRQQVLAYVHAHVMGTWTLTLAARAAGQTEQQVVGALMELQPLRFGTQGHGHAYARALFTEAGRAPRGSRRPGTMRASMPWPHSCASSTPMC